MDPGKTPHSSSSQQEWDAKYHFDALNNQVQGQLRDVQATMTQLLAKFEEISTTANPTAPAPVNNRRVVPPRDDRDFELHEGEASESEQFEDEHAEDERVGDNTAQFYPLQRPRHGFGDRGRGRGGAQFRPQLQRPRRNVHPEQNRYGHADGLLSNIKTTIPEFEGTHDPDAYLDWERKVDKIFECYDFPELKKVQLASLEFKGYAATWWEFQQNRRRKDRYPPIDTWQEMKDVMRGRFIPVHYERELEKKLSRIRQGTRSIEEYHKELETALNRVGKEETLFATLNRYIEGMNPDIACEVELKTFDSIEAMIHYATIVERQIREGRRRSFQPTPARTPWTRGDSSTPRTAPTRPQGQPERSAQPSAPPTTVQPQTRVQFACTR